MVAINVLASFVHFRYDLTAEKRYSLSTPTKTLLKNLDQPLEVEVFLKGDFPAGLPAWMHEQDGWAKRTGSDEVAKRRNITINVPKGIVA